MRNIIVLLTKDCTPKEALPCYNGCKYWEGKTPNIDDLASKGTVFHRHYTAGGSTAMSMSAMLTGRYLYEFKSRKFYTKVKESEFPSIYDTFQAKGYDCHLIFDHSWRSWCEKYVAEFGDMNKVVYHGIDMDQATDRHTEDEYILNDDVLLKKSLEQIKNVFDSIDTSKKSFVWLHLPHIIKGRNSYMSDIDAFDTIVGYARTNFGDENIIISTDHGHMNMHKHIAGYGFHVYEPIINIPLITPRIDNVEDVYYITSNTDLPHILLTNTLPQPHKYTICETKYRGQSGRVLGIVSERYKYIYNEKSNNEELYDLQWDPYENFNILERSYYDKDRKYRVYYDEHYFYPYKEEAISALQDILAYKKTIWYELTLQDNIEIKIIEILKRIKNIIRKL